MECRHERLECTNNVLRCTICGAVLPLEMLGTTGTPSVSAEGAATFPEGEGFETTEAAATFPEGEDFESAEAAATYSEEATPSVSAEGTATFPEGEGFEAAKDEAENPRRIGFESHKEPAKPRRSRKGK